MAHILDYEQEALVWARQGYGRTWRRHVYTSPNHLPVAYRHLWWHPFGIPEWNAYTMVLRLAQAIRSVTA